MKTNKLENLIFSIIESKTKSLMVYLITAVLFALSIYTLPSEIVKAKMLPGKNSDTFSIYVDLKESSSLTQTKEVTQCIANFLKQEKEINSFSIFLGEGQPLDFAGMVKGSALKMSEHESEIMINITKADKRDESSYNLIHRIRPNIQTNCTMYNANIKFIELPAGPPVLASLVAEIYGGETYESRRDFAKEVADVLKDQKTLVDIDVIADVPFKKFSLILNNNKVLESAVSLEQVKKILYLAFEGMEIGIVNEKDAENQIPIFLRLDDSRLFKSKTKKDVENKLSNLKLMNKKGMMIPLSVFITIKEVIQEPTLTSKNLNPVINVIAETDNDSQIYPLLDARNQMIEQFSQNYTVVKADMLNLEFVDKQTHEKFRLVWDGELQVTIDTFIDLGGAFIGALVLIYFLMVMYYKNFSISGGIVLSSFVSIIGVIFAHYIMDLFTADTFYLTATSLIGFIGLIGINSRNSTLIIDFSKQLMDEKGVGSNRAIAMATATRAKPILLTVLTMVFASSLLATDAVFGGLGVALIGGTLMSYIVSLFFVPVILKKAITKI